MLRLMGGRAKLTQKNQAAAEGSVFLNAFLSEVTGSKGLGPAMYPLRSLRSSAS